MPAADVQECFRRAFLSAPALAFPVGTPPQRLRELERGWWRDLVRRVFSPLGPFPGFDEFFEELFSHFAGAEAWRLYPETTAVISTLAERGFTLGVVSNFDSRLFGILEGLGIAQFFGSVTISSRAGAAKPQVEIFRLALRLHGLAPAEAVHAGDSSEMDVAGALSAGITPVLVDRRGRGHADRCRAVDDLRGLLQLLG